MHVKKYLFAGLDFIFDQDGNPWFLEANGSPHGLRNFDRLYPERRFPELVAKFMLKQGKELCVVTSLSDKFEKNKENGLWVYHRLIKHIPNLRLCYVQHNSHREKTLIDTKGELFEPNCIFRYGQKISNSFERRISMINPMVMRYIAMDKLLTIKIVKKRLPDTRIPKTFLVKDTAELRMRIKENPESFKDGYVIKPNYESLGFGVRVFSSPEEKCIIRKPKILQQRITPNLIGGNYWDLRVFLFDGKLVGGEIRKSEHKVTNVSIGSTPHKVPPNLMKKVKKLAEEIVKAIDDEAYEISKSERRFRELKNSIPPTVKNK